jgi:hypothetical protein
MYLVPGLPSLLRLIIFRKVALILRRGKPPTATLLRGWGWGVEATLKGTESSLITAALCDESHHLVKWILNRRLRHNDPNLVN